MAFLQPRCTSTPKVRRSLSLCCTGCIAEATIALEATSGKAKLDMAMSGRRRGQRDELWHPIHTAWQEAADREERRRIVGTATLQPE